MGVTARRPVFSLTPWFVGAGVLIVLLGGAVASELAAGHRAVAIAVAVYVLLIAVAWRLTRGNVVVVVAFAYLLAPAPADNILPQLNIFPVSDLSVRPRDAFYLADIVLLGAIVALRAQVWRVLVEERLVRWWMVGLAVLATYPILIGLWFGPGQPVSALMQGATMPLRGVGIVMLVAAWARLRGWQLAVRDITRTIVLCGAALAVCVVLAVVAARGEQQFSAFGYPLIVDTRPALPGWGNNILANFLCVCVAICVFCRSALDFSRKWLLLALIGVALVGIVFTQVRTAMMCALVLALTPVAVAVVRRVWPSRGGVWAITAGVMTGIMLTVVTAAALPLINPRFSTLTPSVIRDGLPDRGKTYDTTKDPEQSTVDASTGVDLGGESASTRGKLARAAGKLWWRNPVAGIGWNGWGWGKSELAPMGPPPIVPLVVGVDPHNGLLWLLAEAGVLGVVLLYAIPAWVAARTPGRWWLWAPLVVATVLELVNPNLRNGHFAVAVWALAVLALMRGADSTAQPATMRAWVYRAVRSLRGAPVDNPR